METYDLIEEEKAVHEADSWLGQNTFNSVTEEIYQRGSFTVAIIHAAAGKKFYEGVGFSKARQEVTIAQYDPERGKTVARGRAIHDLYQEFKKDKKK